MPNVPIRGTGEHGINRDVEPVLLPPNAWSDGLNVIFDNGSVSKRDGYSRLADSELSVSPQNIIYWPRPVTDYIIYADRNEVYRTSNGTDRASIVRSGANYDTDGIWQSSLFNGGYTVIMNNTINPPQYTTYGTAGAVQETTLQELPGWPANLACGIIRGHRNALIAGNLSNTAVNPNIFQPGSIRISSQAAPGAIPSTWTVGATLTTTADEFELSQTSEVREIVDLRNVALVFTGDSIHSIRLSNGTGPTTVQNLNYGKGILATNCATEVEGRVFAVDRNDIYVTSGSGSITSVADQRIRDYFFDNLNQTHYANTFVSRNGAKDQVWVCFPDLTSTGDCNKAIVWDYRHDEWTIYDIPSTRSGTEGVDISTNNMLNEHLILGQRGANPYLQVMDRGTTFDGTNFTAYVERKRLDMTDIESTKWSKAIYPLLSGTGNVDIYVAGTNQPGQDVTLNVARYQETFRIADDYKINPRENGRFLNIRFQSTDTAQWTLAGYSINTEADDRR